MGLIKSANGYLFGWWTPISWESSTRGKYAAAPSTFIFTLTNPAGVPAKYNTVGPQNALYYHANYGPVLGWFDILVNDNSNSNTNSNTNFPHVYGDSTGRGKNTFTGNFRFQVSELEVFVPV